MLEASQFVSGMLPKNWTKLRMFHHDLGTYFWRKSFTPLERKLQHLVELGKPWQIMANLMANRWSFRAVCTGNAPNLQWDLIVSVWMQQYSVTLPQNWHKKHTGTAVWYLATASPLHGFSNLLPMCLLRVENTNIWIPLHSRFVNFPFWKWGPNKFSIPSLKS